MTVDQMIFDTRRNRLALQAGFYHRIGTNAVEDAVAKGTEVEVHSNPTNY